MIVNMKPLLACTGLALILGVSPVKAESLQQALAMALSTHPSLEAAAAEKEVATEVKTEARSGYFPTVNASAYAGRMYGDNATTRGLTTSRGAAWSNTWEGSASIVQPLFDGFETSNKVDAAQARMEASDFRLLDERETLALEVTQAFLNVLRAQATYEKTREYVKKLDDYGERIKSMVENGAADTAEEAQAKNVRLQLGDTLAEREGQLKNALAAYAAVVGTMPASFLENPALIDVERLGALDEAKSLAKSNHPALMEAEKALAAADYDVKAQKAVLYPDITGEVSYLESDKEEELGGEVVDGRAIVRLNWSLATGGAEFARIAQTKAGKAQIKAQRREMEREIDRNVRLAFNELEIAQKQLDIANERLQVTQDLFDSYETQFEGARIRLLQLMQSDNQLFTAKLDKVDAEYRLLLAQYSLLAAIGKLQEGINTSAYAVAANTGTVVGPSIDEEPLERIDDDIMMDALVEGKK